MVWLSSFNLTRRTLRRFAVMIRHSNLQKLSLLFSSLLILVIGCGRSSDSSATSSDSVASVPTASATTPGTSPTPSETPASPNAADSTEISINGIGAARLGITLGELKDILGEDVEFEVQSPFIVDFDAIAVKKGDEVLYHILYLAGASFGDEDVIQGLLTENPKFKTPEGVGAGTPIAEAEQAYGKVTLSYNTQNESREYARFEKQPANNLSFGTGNGNQSTAGIYNSPASDFNETAEFRPDATIQSVWVVCLSEDCAPSGDQ